MLRNLTNGQMEDTKKHSLIEKYKKEWSLADANMKSLKLNKKFSLSREEQGKKIAYAHIINDLILS